MRRLTIAFPGELAEAALLHGWNGWRVGRGPGHGGTILTVTLDSEEADDWAALRDLQKRVEGILGRRVDLYRRFVNDAVFRPYGAPR